MANEENLSAFSAHLEAYNKHRLFIERARSQGSKFSAAVIEKVTLEHEIKSAEEADAILALVPGLEAARASLVGELSGLSGSQAGVNQAMEELELRQMIGELDEEGFAAESSALKAQMGDSGEAIERLEAQIASINAVLERWAELAESAGQATGLTPEESDDLEEVAESEEAEAFELEVDFAEPDVEGDAEAQDEFVEELPGFGDDGEDGEAADDDGEDGEAADEIVEAAEEDFSDEDGDYEEEDEAAEDEAAEDDFDRRRALVIYEEGTTEEQFYPFTGDDLTIGRGRDNDIQIKNDSKVSRYHCRIFRRNAHFFIEDNKSSNGTLKNGANITAEGGGEPVRLFGGEEIMVGETFFRFRILD